MNKFFKLSVFALSLLWLGACDDNNETPAPQFSDEVIVVNEGNFQAANGLLTSYNKETEQTNLSRFDAATTIQGSVVEQNTLYLVGNAPDKVDIVNVEDYTEITSINSGFSNPISLAIVNNTGFVSNWGDISTAFSGSPDSFISVIDLGTNTVVDSVQLNYRPQDLISHDGFIYIAFEGGNVVGKLNPSTLTIEELTVPAGPSEFVLDNTGNLWVLTTSGSLVEIIINNFSQGRTLSNLIVSGFAEKMDINRQDNILYFLGSDAAYEVDLNESTLAALIFTDEDIDYYGIGVDPATGDVYIGDSGGFTAAGTAFRYSKDGTLLDDFPTGIGPNDFLFY